MGYTTEFKGVLQFTTELKASQLAFLTSILKEDCREHPEWDAKGLSYIDLQLTADFSGIEWDGAEKSYDMDHIVNVVIRLMRDKWPAFGLKGKFIAQGEDIDDRWELTIENNWAVRHDIVISGQKVTCPHCEEMFVLENPEGKTKSNKEV